MAEVKHTESIRANIVQIGTLQLVLLCVIALLAVALVWVIILYTAQRPRNTTSSFEDEGEAMQVYSTTRAYLIERLTGSEVYGMKCLAGILVVLAILVGFLWVSTIIVQFALFGRLAISVEGLFYALVLYVMSRGLHLLVDIRMKLHDIEKELRKSTISPP